MYPWIESATDDDVYRQSLNDDLSGTVNDLGIPIWRPYSGCNTGNEAVA